MKSTDPFDFCVFHLYLPFFFIDLLLILLFFFFDIYLFLVAKKTLKLSFRSDSILNCFSFWLFF
jgi:hypothetical protein